MNAPDLLLSQLGYQLLGELKRGGMGAVYLARRQGAHGFERLVAIKTLLSELAGDSRLQQMFQDEARLMAQLHHPNIAQVYDFGERGGTLFLVMEYVPGISFVELARRRPPAPVAARAIAEACRGLHAAHELTDRYGRSLGVVHRDISPSNLMLTYDGAVKVLDFGIAWNRARATPKTEYGTLKGKPPYMSPEQLRNQPLDRRADIYSVSLVLHELLTGRRMYTNGSPYTVALAIADGDVTPPSHLADRALPAGLDAIVLKGMARERDLRFASSLELALALETCIPGAPTLHSYAAESLRELHDTHQRRLEGMLQSVSDRSSGAAKTPEPRRAGRPTDVATKAIIAASAAAPTTKETGRGPQQQAASDGRSVRLWIAALVGLTALGATLALRHWPSGSRDTQKAATPDTTTIADVRPSAAAGDLSAPRSTLAISTSDGTPPQAIPQAALPTATAAAHDAASGAVIAARDASAAAAGRARAAHPRGVHRRLRAKQQRGVATASASTPTARRRRIGETQPSNSEANDVSPGYLSVGAEPYAIVVVNGKEIGATPIVRHRLAAGSYRVELLFPHNRTIRQRQVVQIEPGGTRRIVLRQ
jgi:serine/threonine protein kinase